MDPQHEAPDVTPDALDQELRAVLNVEPSAFFTTRVRARVASESMSRAWWPAPLRVVGLAAVVLAAGATTGWLMRMPHVPRSATESTRPPVAEMVPLAPRATVAPMPSTGARVDSPTASVEPGPTMPDSRSRQAIRPVASGGRSLVPVNQESFGRAWLAAVDRGLVTVAIVQPRDVPQPMNSPSIALDVPPITIAPVIVEAMAPFAE